MPQIAYLPKSFPLDSGSNLMAGAKAYWTITLTTTPKDTYTDYALSVANTNPVVADGNGIFPTTFLKNDVRYRLTLKTSADVLIYTQDDIGGPVITQAELGAILYPRTSAELGAGVTPTNYAYAPGYRARYLTLADQIAVSASHPAFISDDETITASITVPTNAQIYGIGRPQITNSTAGAHVFGGDACANVIIDGIRFKGANSSTTPGTSVGGFAATSTGLITLTSGSDIRVTNCEFDTFYNGLSVLNSSRVWIQRNRITHWLTYAVLASRCVDFWIDFNELVGCDQAGAVGAYGVSATGDEAGGSIQKACSISFNVIRDVPSWDGIMTHDCDGMRIIGNDIRNVRNGIDVGHSVAANVVKHLEIANNYIEATTTNTWGGTGAIHNAILVLGFDTSNRIKNAVISGNIIQGFYNISGTTLSGNTAHIVVGFCDRAVIADNIIAGGGTAPLSPAGIFIPFNCSTVSINGNDVQGSFAAAAIRLANATVDVLSIADNSVLQTTTSDASVSITSSTVSAFSLKGNPTNSTAPFTTSASTITYSDEFLRGSATFDPPSLADAAGTTTTVTVSGAVLGDLVEAVSFSLDLQGITLTAYVSSNNTVSARFQNESGGVLDLGSGTLRALVRRS